MDSIDSVWLLFGFYMTSVLFRWVQDWHNMDYYRIRYGFDTDSVSSPCGLCVVCFVSFRLAPCPFVLVHVGSFRFVSLLVS